MNIFLSTPFSSRVTPAGMVDAAYRAQIKALIEGLRTKNHIVFSALEHAHWELGGLTKPEEELRRDFAEIEGCDKLIILLEERVSAGVQLETGYAFGKDKMFDMYQIGQAAWSNIAFSKMHGNKLIAVGDVGEFVDHVLRNN